LQIVASRRANWTGHDRPKRASLHSTETTNNRYSLRRKIEERFDRRDSERTNTASHVKLNETKKTALVDFQTLINVVQTLQSNANRDEIVPSLREAPDDTLSIVHQNGECLGCNERSQRSL
jgi:hypothetical protein